MGFTKVLAVGESTTDMKEAVPRTVTTALYVLGPQTQLDESGGPELTGSRSLVVS